MPQLRALRRRRSASRQTEAGADGVPPLVARQNVLRAGGALTYPCCLWATCISDADAVCRGRIHAPGPLDCGVDCVCDGALGLDAGKVKRTYPTYLFA